MRMATWFASGKGSSGEGFVLLNKRKIAGLIASHVVAVCVGVIAWCESFSQFITAARYRQ